MAKFVSTEMCEKIQQLQKTELSSLEKLITEKFNSLNKTVAVSVSAVGFIILIADFILRCI